MTAKKHGRRRISNFEARSVALFMTLTLGSAMAAHAQKPVSSPFVIGGTAAPAQTRKDTPKPPKAEATDKAAQGSKKTAGEISGKANPPAIGRGESPPKPEAGEAKN